MRKILLGVVIPIFLVSAGGIIYFFSVTEPLYMNSYNVCFSQQFDIKARYWIDKDSVEIFVLVGTLRHPEDFKETITLDTIMFGLSRRCGEKCWNIEEGSNEFPIRVTTGPGEERFFFFKRFSIPIDASVDLSKRWVTLEAATYEGTDKPVRWWYAHSGKDIFSSRKDF